jgi:hypothetical protein
MGAHDRISPDPSISRHKSPNVVCWHNLPEHDTLARSGDSHLVDHHLGMSWSPRTTTYIQSRASSPHATGLQAEEDASRREAEQ